MPKIIFQPLMIANPPERLTELITKKLRMKKETWKTVFQIVLSILTAIAASLGVTSCM